MPGVVIAFALSYFTERYGNGFLYQSAPLLIICYAIMFFPLALVGVKASLARGAEAPGRTSSAGSPCSGG